MLRRKPDSELKAALEDYIEELEDTESDISSAERMMIGNVLKLRNKKVYDVMVPRAQMVAVPIDISEDDFLKLLSEKQYSRIPVYYETLDSVLGALHIKDLFAAITQGKAFDLPSLIREIPVVSPALPVTDLVLEMREKQKHMALVVDEYGGIDGLVTINDVVEQVMGDLDDEFDPVDDPSIILKEDGTILAEGRAELIKIEELLEFSLFSDEEKENNDTLAGLIFSLEGRIPARGEIITHPDKKMIFEILENSPRTIKRIRLRNIPKPDAS